MSPRPTSTDSRLKASTATWRSRPVRLHAGRAGDDRPLSAPDRRALSRRPCCPTSHHRHRLPTGGYRTSYVGKWHLASSQNIIGHNAGADYWVHPKLRGGFEDWFGFELSNHFWRTHYCTDDSMWPPKVLDGYQTDRLTDLSLDYLDSVAVKLTQPWFHVLSVEAPHHGSDEHGVTRCQVGEYVHARHPAPPAYEARFAPEELTLRDNVPATHEAVARSQQAQYTAQIANLDDNVGRVLAWLDERDLMSRTLVCFFSDHGEMGGSHGRFQKGCAYDESLRVPCLIRQPGRVPPGNYGRPINLVDLFPTCAGLCGVPLPQRMPRLKDARQAALSQWFGNPRYHPEGRPGAPQRECVVLAVVIDDDAVAAIERAFRNGVEQVERGNDGAGGQDLDLQVAAGHVVDLPGEVGRVLVENVLRRPGALPTHRDRALRLDDHREGQRSCTCGGSRADELAA